MPAPTAAAPRSAEFRGRRLQYVVVSGKLFDLVGESFDEWLSKTGGEVVGSATATMTVSVGPQRWYVVRFWQ